ncbi:MAG: hypothetical protein J1F16_06690 [Muribaculaceae bacterium]|nr:hypothetical protein [Muribaculaceae bacterium]
MLNKLETGREENTCNPNETPENSVDRMVREIKQDFFRYRNGIIADSVKKLYPDGTMVFGLMVPQFIELSRKYPKDIKLGLKLWDESTSREGRLFSLFLIPPKEIRFDKAKEMLLNVRSNEEAEFLAFRILRNIPDARILYTELEKEEMKNPYASYCKEMFRKNLDLAQ